MEPEKRWLLLFPAVLIYSRRHRFCGRGHLSGHPAMVVAMMYPDGEKGEN
jgi:hypothetical protein